MGFRVGFLSLIIFAFVIFLIAGLLTYKGKYNTKYNLKNYFPFELNFKRPYSENFFGNSAFIIMGISGIAFYSTFDLKFNNYSILVMVIGIISSLILIALYFVPLEKIRAHILIFVISMLCSIVLVMSTFICSFRMRQFYEEINQKYNFVLYISMVGSLIVTLIMTGFALNPRLNFNFRLIEETSDDGKTIYKRPKMILPAFYEWVFIFTFLINTLLVFLLYLA